MLTLHTSSSTTVQNQKVNQRRGQTIQHLPVKLRVFYDTPYFKDFQIKNNVITYKQRFKFSYSQLLINEQIPENCEFHMKWKINQMKNSAIFLGITSLDNKMERTCHHFSNSYCYFSKKNLVFPTKNLAGKGFQQGSIVEIIFNRKQHWIKWVVDQKLQAKIQKYNPFYSKAPFVPFIQMLDSGDSVTWLGCWSL